jgi:hypothetical protein
LSIAGGTFGYKFITKPVVLVENGFYISLVHGLFYFPLNKLNGHIKERL